MDQIKTIFRSPNEAIEKLTELGFRTKNYKIWVRNKQRAYVTRIKREVVNEDLSVRDYGVGWIVSLWEPPKSLLSY